MNVRTSASSAIILVVALFCSSCASTLVNIMNKKVKPIASTSEPIEHDLWNDLLMKYVQPDGKVNYKGIIKDRSQFDAYIELLEQNHPNDKNWSRNESIAYWINAYNAFTVQTIIDNYPVTSIKDIKGGITFVSSIWDQKFITIEDQQYDLNNIEQGILRKYYQEPRIHFAVNCASISCPPLANFAFTGDLLDSQLDLMTRVFLEDSSKNVISSDHLQLSKIFNWYKSDFKKGQSLKEYINAYTDVEIDPKAKISYLDYDWGLNDVDN